MYSLLLGVKNAPLMSSNGPLGAHRQFPSGLLFTHRFTTRRGFALKFGFSPSYAHDFADVPSKDRITSPTSAWARVAGADRRHQTLLVTAGAIAPIFFGRGRDI